MDCAEAGEALRISYHELYSEPGARQERIRAHCGGFCACSRCGLTVQTIRVPNDSDVGWHVLTLEFKTFWGLVEANSLVPEIGQFARWPKRSLHLSQRSGAPEMLSGPVPKAIWKEKILIWLPHFNFALKEVPNARFVLLVLKSPSRKVWSLNSTFVIWKEPPGFCGRIIQMANLLSKSYIEANSFTKLCLERLSVDLAIRSQNPRKIWWFAVRVKACIFARGAVNVKVGKPTSGFVLPQNHKGV